MNFHQTPEEIVKHSSPEQQILWNYIFLRFGEKIGLSQLYYSGIIAGSEFALAYDAHRLYVALEFQASVASTTAVNAPGYCILYNDLNVIKGYFQGSFPVWDTTAVALKYIIASLVERNIWFSKITATGFTNMVFNGYRLSI